MPLSKEIDENLVEKQLAFCLMVIWSLQFAENGSSSWYASVDLVASDWKSVGESQISSDVVLRCVDESEAVCLIWGDWCRLADRNGGDGDATGLVFDIILFILNNPIQSIWLFNKKKNLFLFRLFSVSLRTVLGITYGLTDSKINDFVFFLNWFVLCQRCVCSLRCV